MNYCGWFVGGGIFVIVPQFFAEIASDRVRGILGSTLVMSSNVGVLLAFILGNYCDYYTTPKIVIGLTIIFAISLFFFPESPSFLIIQNKILDTEKSVRFYQDLRRNTLLRMELDKLKNLAANGENKTKETDSLKWSDLTTGVGKRAMIIGIVLAGINQFCGCFAMLNYTANIFREAGSSMSPNMSAICVGILQLFGSYIAMFLVDRTGRKFLFAVSTIGCSLGLTTLGVYMMLKSWRYEVDAFNWIPLASFSFVIFIASWAILTLPFLVISEVMPTKMKNFGMSFCMTLLWSCQFFMLKFLPLLIELFSFHGCMFLFASCCLSAALFIILRVPETKAKSYEEIMEILR